MATKKKKSITKIKAKNKPKAKARTPAKKKAPARSKPKTPTKPKAKSLAAPPPQNKNPFGISTTSGGGESGIFWFSSVESLISDLTEGDLGEFCGFAETDIIPELEKIKTWETLLAMEAKLYEAFRAYHNTPWADLSLVEWPDPLIADFWLESRRAFLQDQDLNNDQGEIPNELVDDYIQFISGDA